MSTDEYERGYRNGESNVNADWHIALSEVVEDPDLDTWSPSAVAKYVAMLEELRWRLEGLEK